MSLLHHMQFWMVTIIATCSGLALATKYCRKSGGISYLGYTSFDGAAHDGPTPPRNLTATCIEKRESKWVITIQWDVSDDFPKTAGYVMVWYQMNALGSVMSTCRRIGKVKNSTRVLLQRPNTGPVSGYRFKVYGVNKNGNISNKFALILVTQNKCKKGADRVSPAQSECTSIGQPVGIVTNESDWLGVKFGVHLGRSTDQSSISVAYRSLHGHCNWWNSLVTSDILPPGYYVLNVTLTDSEDEPCALTWGSKIKFEVNVRYDAFRTSRCDARRSVTLTLPLDPGTATPSSQGQNVSSIVLSK